MQLVGCEDLLRVAAVVKIRPRHILGCGSTGARQEFHRGTLDVAVAVAHVARGNRSVEPPAVVAVAAVGTHIQIIGGVVPQVVDGVELRAVIDKVDGLGSCQCGSIQRYFRKYILEVGTLAAVVAVELEIEGVLADIVNQHSHRTGAALVGHVDGPVAAESGILSRDMDGERAAEIRSGGYRGLEAAAVGIGGGTETHGKGSAHCSEVGGMRHENVDGVVDSVNLRTELTREGERRDVGGVVQRGGVDRVVGPGTAVVATNGAQFQGVLRVGVETGEGVEDGVAVDGAADDIVGANRQGVLNGFVVHRVGVLNLPGVALAVDPAQRLAGRGLARFDGEAFGRLAARLQLEGHVVHIDTDIAGTRGGTVAAQGHIIARGNLRQGELVFGVGSGGIEVCYRSEGRGIGRVGHDTHSEGAVEFRTGSEPEHQSVAVHREEIRNLGHDGQLGAGTAGVHEEAQRAAAQVGSARVGCRRSGEILAVVAIPAEGHVGGAVDVSDLKARRVGQLEGAAARTETDGRRPFAGVAHGADSSHAHAVGRVGGQSAQCVADSVGCARNIHLLGVVDISRVGNSIGVTLDGVFYQVLHRTGFVHVVPG